MRTASESRSAAEKPTTLSSPRALHARTMRTAISPRFATNTRRISVSLTARSNGLDAEERLVVLDEHPALG